MNRINWFEGLEASTQLPGRSSNFCLSRQEGLRGSIPLRVIGLSVERLFENQKPLVISLLFSSVVLLISSNPVGTQRQINVNNVYVSVEMLKH